MLARIKNIHPGWFIGGFFALLISFNIAFFTLAAVKGAQITPPGTTQDQARVMAIQHAADQAAADRGETPEPRTGPTE